MTEKELEDEIVSGEVFAVSSQGLVYPFNLCLENERGMVSKISIGNELVLREQLKFINETKVNDRIVLTLVKEA